MSDRFSRNPGRRTERQEVAGTNFMDVRPQSEIKIR